MKVIIVGLGTSEDNITLAAYNTIMTAKDKNRKLIFKTSKGLIKAFSDIEHETMDELYEINKDFDALNAAILEKVSRYSKHNEVIYCVHGNPCLDGSVRLLLSSKKDVEIIAGQDYSLDALKHYPSDSYSVSSAYAILKKRTIDTSSPLIILEIDDKELAGALKVHLGLFYLDEQYVTFLYEGKAKKIRLYELDRQKAYNHTATAIIEGRSFLQKERYSYGDLLDIMAWLIGENGCEWDRVQTHKSIRSNLLEEAYEVLDAIDNDDQDNLIEELGDYLLQSIFHIAIAEKNNEFNGTDVLDRLCKKLIVRHPHVFKKEDAKDAVQALNFWEQAKATEKDTKTLHEDLLRLPSVLPQTLRAVKVGKKAVKAGIGKGVDTLLCVESAENAIENLSRNPNEQSLGEALFAICTLARLYRLDPEISLRKIVDFHIERFRKIENNALKSGKRLSELSIEELERILVEIVYNEE